MHGESILLIILSNLWAVLFAIVPWLIRKIFGLERDLQVLQAHKDALREQVSDQRLGIRQRHQEIMEYIREANTAQNSKLEAIDRYLRNGFK